MINWWKGKVTLSEVCGKFGLLFFFLRLLRTLETIKQNESCENRSDNHKQPRLHSNSALVFTAVLKFVTESYSYEKD